MKHLQRSPGFLLILFCLLAMLTACQAEPSSMTNMKKPDAAHLAMRAEPAQPGNWPLEASALSPLPTLPSYGPTQPPTPAGPFATFTPLPTPSGTPDFANVPPAVY